MDPIYVSGLCIDCVIEGGGLSKDSRLHYIIYSIVREKTYKQTNKQTNIQTYKYADIPEQDVLELRLLLIGFFDGLATLYLRLGDFVRRGILIRNGQHIDIDTATEKVTFAKFLMFDACCCYRE